MKVPIPFASLYPSQYSGEISIEMARWRGNWREFWVQWHEDRVFFQLADGEPTVWASLETCARDEAIACSQNAVCERRYGVCFEQCTNVYPEHGMLPLRFQFIYAPDGTGFLREWCSRDWIAFAPNETRAWAFFPDLHLPQIGAEESQNCCIYAVKSVREQIMFRRVSEADMERLSWKSATNEAEFERVVNFLWNAEWIARVDANNHYLGVSFGNSIPHAKTWFHLSNLSCQPALESWLKTYFVGEGFEWRSLDWGARRYRKLRARTTFARLLRARRHALERLVSKS